MSIVTEKDLDLIAEMYARGLSAGEISRKMPGRSRNSIIGIISRARDRCDQRFKISHATSTHWTDAQLLRLMHLRENENLGWRTIGLDLHKTSAECKAKYAEIRQDEREHAA